MNESAPFFASLSEAHLREPDAPAGVIAHLCAATIGAPSINLTADTYGKWLPLWNKAAMDRLDATIYL